MSGGIREVQQGDYVKVTEAGLDSPWGARTVEGYAIRDGVCFQVEGSIFYQPTYHQTSFHTKIEWPEENVIVEVNKPVDEPVETTPYETSVQDSDGYEGERWVVTSGSGGSKQAKMAAFHDIPTDFLWELAEQYGKGNAKYPDAEVPGSDLTVSNWRRGYNWSLSFAAAYRHLTLAMGGQDVDPETGTKHVVAVAWHMAALTHWLNNPELHKYDDRQDKIEKEIAND